MLAETLGDEMPQVRAVAAVALGEYGPRAAAAVPELMRWIHHSQMREVVIRTIGQIGEEARAAIPTLVEITKNAQVRPSIRRRAIEASRQIGSDRAAVNDAIETALKDPNSRIRHAAETALKELGDQRRGGDSNP